MLEASKVVLDITRKLFWNNFMNFKELNDFDYLMRIDDDS